MYIIQNHIICNISDINIYILFHKPIIRELWKNRKHIIWKHFRAGYMGILCWLDSD